MVKLITSVVALVLDNNDDDDDDKWFSFTKYNIFAPKTSTIDLTSEVSEQYLPNNKFYFTVASFYRIRPRECTKFASVLHCTIPV